MTRLESRHGLALAAALLAAAALCAPAQDPKPQILSQTRSRIDLCGPDWTMTTLKGPGSENPPAQDAPRVPFAVPGEVLAPAKEVPEHLWFRRTIRVPQEWAGRRIFLNVRGAKYRPAVYADGKFVGSYGDGWTPFEVELTDFVAPGGTHEIAIRCGDRSAVEDPAVKGKVGKTIAPVGSSRDISGPWLPVYLDSYAGPRIPDLDLEIVTSVRNGTLTLRGRVDQKGEEGGAPLKLFATVLDGDEAVLDVPETPVGDGRWEVSAPFRNAKLWSPESPHLYTLRLRLVRDGKVVDELLTPFGFKEVWAEGPDIVLNGVKRRILASSTWPVAWLPREEVFRRVQRWKDEGLVAFRFHNQPWQEDWYDACDRIGILTVGEMAIYTDESGIYAYANETFWNNYKEHVRGLIRRDRNRASLFLWSLGNEVLFMGNERYDKDLPKKLGMIGRYAKSLDPTHLTIFEADRDPDGAFDVVGLHYPHEMPAQHAYPNCAFWLDERIEAEAGGGMLGQKSGSFFWDRKKPLYIGEYLWVPTGDYAVATIWFGDDAFRNRQKFHKKAQIAAWFDQTVAYRVSGVSAVSPWTVYWFGGVFEDQEASDAQKEFYRLVAAYPVSRGTRLYEDEERSLRFDVVNDGPEELSLVLRMRDERGESIAETEVGRLAPSESKRCDLVVEPSEAGVANWTMELAAGERILHKAPMRFQVVRKTDPRAPKGRSLVVLNAENRNGFSIRDLNPGKDILLIDAGALTPEARRTDIPVLGAQGFDAVAFQNFLKQGGRAVVLEQETLAPLGLGVDLIDYASTMAFPISESHPLWKGLGPDGLKFWADDNFIAKKQIRRNGRAGLGAVAVSGGENGLAQGPVFELPFGKGRVVFLQALVREKMAKEPAAQILLQNAIDRLAALPDGTEKPLVAFGATETTERILRDIGVLWTKGGDLSAEDAGGLILLDGDSDARLVRESVGADSLVRFVREGGTLLWRNPAESVLFQALCKEAGFEGLRIVDSGCSGMIADRNSPLLAGISREEFVHFTTTGWERIMTIRPDRTPRRLAPAASATELPMPEPVRSHVDLRDGALFFERSGDATWNLPNVPAGLYELSFEAKATEKDGRLPLLAVQTNGDDRAFFELKNPEFRRFELPIRMSGGDASVGFVFTNGIVWGGGPTFEIRNVRLRPVDRRFESLQWLADPGSLVVMPLGKGRVVLDLTEWKDESPDKALRFFNSLLRNLGAPFATPAAPDRRENIPLSALRLIGESAYFTQTPNRIECRNNAVLETRVLAATPGKYEFRAVAASSPLRDVFAVVDLEIDGRIVGSREIRSTGNQAHELGTAELSAGEHVLRLLYRNDEFAENGEDRNLFLCGLSAKLVGN